MKAEKEINHGAMYLRISQEKKNENIETLANHRQLLKEYCKNNGYTYEEFGEVLSGGASELEARPKLQELLARIEEFDAILVVELSRLSRNGYISQTVKKYCMEYDKPIVTPYQMYDLANNENDRLMFDVGSMISSHEHGIIGKRSKTNKIQMAKQGLHISGNVPFGYRRNNDTKKLYIYDEEAEVVRYIFKLHSQGLGSFKIRDILNNEGYKSAKGKYFNLPSIKRIIKNPAYKGLLIFNDRKRVKKNGKFTYEIMDKIIVEDAHPAIIPPEVWDEVNKDREDRAKKSAITREKPAVKTGVTMLKDLIYCSVCGRKMTIRKDNKLKMYTLKKCEYLLPNGEKCNNAGIKLDFIEKNVLIHLKKYKDQLQKVLHNLKTDDTSSVEAEQKFKLSQLEKRIIEIFDQQKKLIDLALTGIFSNEELKEKKQELTDTLVNLEMQRKKIISEMSKLSIEDMKTQIEGTLAKIESLEVEENVEALNEALKTIIKRINYSRVIPEELLKKSTKNHERKNYPFLLEIEYF